MSLTSRLSGALRSALRSPQARRAARDLMRSAEDALGGADDAQGRSGTGRRESPARTTTRTNAPRNPSPTRIPSPSGTSSRAGSTDDHRALADRPSQPPLPLTYAPVDDDRADPGEIAWAWVAFEEDLARGKDRPVLVLAREDASIGGRDGSGTVHVCLMLTSHDRGSGTHTDEHGNTWVDVGSGSWDRQGRASEVRVDRLLRIPLDAVRREGAGLDEERFERVAAAVRRVHGWS